MGRECYRNINFKTATKEMIVTINDILEEYEGQGLRLTVRQLYYQLVARGIIENNIKSYKYIASVVNDARIAGYIDWDMIEDRTRAFEQRQRWSGGRSILDAAANGFHMDMWDNQENRVFLVVEKEALSGVFAEVCHSYDVPMLAARGYPSVSVLRDFVIESLVPFSHQNVIILHFGDHDPSGIDMTRDLEERIALFNEHEGGPSVELIRVALNMDQVEAKKPPPNPAKLTDSRCKQYMRKFGKTSWELDALDPKYLNKLVRDHVSPLIDQDAWEARQDEIERIRKRIIKAAKTFK